MAVTYIKLGPAGDVFSSEELGIFLTKNNAVEVNNDLTSTRLKAFFLTGFLVRISKVEYDNIKLNNSIARNIPLVTVDITATRTEEPVEAVRNDPPENPIRNKRYLIWDKPTGSWETYENCIAWFTGYEWNFIAPYNGLSLPIFNLGLSAVYSGTYPSGIWTVGGLGYSEFSVLSGLVNNLSNPLEEPIPQWILDITKEDIDRWNAGGGFYADPDGEDFIDVDSLDNADLLRSLTLVKGYILSNSEKIRAGFADNSQQWNHHEFDDYIDQALRTTDKVRFREISSREFVGGFTGSGWRVDENGDATFDNLTVRKEFNVYEMVINKISGSNGAIAVTDSAELLDCLISEDGTEYICTIDTKDNTIQVPFHVNDLLRCQRWNGESIKYYFGRVTAVGTGLFRLDITTLEGGGVPFKGDSVHRFGNTVDPDRQGLLYLTSSDDNSPYMDVLDGITSSNLAGKTRVRLGKLDGIVDPVYGALEGYGLYTDNGYFRGKLTVIGTGSNVPTKTELDNLLDQIDTGASQEDLDLLLDQAKAYADAEAAYQRVIAQAYADGIVTAEEQARINEAALNLAAAKADATAKVGAIIIGGRNLVKNSALTSITGWAINGGSISYPTVDGRPVLSINSTAFGQGIFTGNAVTIKPNTDYTVSWDIKGAYYEALGVYIGLDAHSQIIQVPNTTTWARLNYTWNSGSTSELRAPVIYGGGGRQQFYVKDFKIEEGNKATAWTPAPEDVAADAQSKADIARSAAQTYSDAQVAYNLTVSQAYADGKVTTEEARAIADAQTKLDQAKADATSKANAAITAANNYTASQIAAVYGDIDDLNVALTNLGGVIDSSFRDGIIESAEAVSIEKYLNTLISERGDLDSRYSIIVSDPLLGGTPKTALINAKQNYNTAHDNLINTIHSAISDGRTTAAEKTAVDNTFATYRTTVAVLSASFEQALDAITEAKSYEIELYSDAKSYTSGKMLYRDATFSTGTNGLTVYNNLGNGTVLLDRLPSSALNGVPNTSGFFLRVRTTGVASPAWGGVTFQTMTRSNAKFVTRMIAFIPVGFKISFASNPYGNGGTVYWVTSQAGTGTWEEYIFVVQCGTNGSFSSTNFFCIEGPSTLEWYIAYASVFDVTDSEVDYLKDAAAKALAAQNAAQGYTDTQTASTYAQAQQYVQNQLNNRIAISEASVLGQASNAAQAKADAARDAANLLTAQLIAGQNVSIASVQTALDAVKTTADAANNAYHNLTLALGPMAYSSIETLAYQGNTVFSGGYLNTVLINAQYIRTNVLNTDFLIARSLATSGGNSITLNQNDDNLLKFRWPNGTVGIKMGIINGELALIFYNEAGIEVWRWNKTGYIYVTAVPDSTTPVEMTKVINATIPVTDAPITLSTSERNNIIAGVKALFQYQTQADRGGYTHNPQTVLIDNKPYASAYLFTAGQPNTNASHNGYHISSDMTSSYIPDGWYVFDGIIGTKLHPLDWDSSQGPQVMYVAVFAIASGTQSGSEVLQIPV